MTTAALVQCRLRENALGLPSRALEDLAGRPVLLHTVERLLRAEGVDAVAVIAPKEEQERLRGVLAPLGAPLLAEVGGDLPRRRQILGSRKWALEGWRGGLLGSTVFDEVSLPPLLSAGEALGAEVVVPVPAEWCLLDPALLSAALGHHRERSGPFGFTFSQAPPGLLPAIYRRERLAEWVERGVTLGEVLRYNPAAPRTDLLLEACGFQVPGALLGVRERLSAETARGLALARLILERLGPGAGAEEMCRFLAENPEAVPGSLPREVELELTTRRPVEDLLRPLPGVGEVEMPLAAASRLIEEAASGGETLLTLGGRGDPLLHPGLGDLLRAARRAGAFGLHLVTYGRELSAETARLVVELEVDAVTFLLDACTAETYARLRGGASMEPVLAGLARLGEARRSAGAGVPIPVVEFMKTRLNLREMEAFYDEWLRRGAWPVIRGPSDRAGLVEDRAVASMAPPRRRPCGRIFRRMTIHADGTVPACEEDIARRQTLGDALKEGIEGVWQGGALERLRGDHLAARWDALPACGNCREWHRP